MKQKEKKSLVRQVCSYENIYSETRRSIENTARSFENKLKEILNRKITLYKQSNSNLKRYINLVFC